MGKTWANAWLMDYALRDGVDIALILDDKQSTPQYKGTQRSTPSDLRARPPTEREHQDKIVFRGHTLRRDMNEACSADEVGRAAFELSNLPEEPRVLVSIDELRRAVTSSGREWEAKSVPRLFSEGGGIGISVTWTTQSPQRIPVEAYDQTDTLGIFRLGRRALNYLRAQDLLDPEALDVLPTLQKGEWILYDAAASWDGKIYKVNA